MRTFPYDQHQYMMHSNVHQQLQKDFAYAKYLGMIALLAVGVALAFWVASLLIYLQAEKEGWLAHAFIVTFTLLIALIVAAGTEGWMGAHKTLKSIRADAAGYASSHGYESFAVETVSPLQLPHGALCKEGSGILWAIQECRNALQNLFDLRMSYVVAAADPQAALTDVYLDAYKKAIEVIQRLIQSKIRYDLAVQHNGIASLSELKGHRIYWTEQLETGRDNLLQHACAVQQLCGNYIDRVNEAVRNPDLQAKERHHSSILALLTLLRERD